MLPNAAIFVRPGGNNSDDYYYHAFLVGADATDTYQVTSSMYNSIDVYCCLYDGNFYPDSPTSNLLACDSYMMGGSQLLIEQILFAYSLRQYILVVTTYYPFTAGSYAVKINGSHDIGLGSFTPTMYYSTTTTRSE